MRKELHDAVGHSCVYVCEVCALGLVVFKFTFIQIRLFAFFIFYILSPFDIFSTFDGWRNARVINLYMYGALTLCGWSMNYCFRRNHNNNNFAENEK